MDNDLRYYGNPMNWEGVKVKGDLISRSALKKAIKSYADDQYAENEYLGECAIMNIIDNAPTANTVNLEKQSFIEGFKEGCEHGKKCYERPQGKWVKKVDDVGFVSHICSECGAEIEVEDCSDDKFCFNCGADMRKGGTEE